MLVQEFLIRHALLSTDGSISLRRASHNVDKDIAHTFSRDPSISKARWCTLPQCLSWQTCAIGFDSPGPHGFTAKWLELAKAMRKLVKSCVVTRGVGGVLKTGDYHIIVTNPARGLAEGICLATPMHLPMSLSRWISAEASDKAASQSLARHSTGSSSAPLSAGDSEQESRDGTYSRTNGFHPNPDPQGLSPTRRGSASSAPGSPEQPHSPVNRLRATQNGQRLLRTTSNGHISHRRVGSELPSIPEPAEANGDGEATV
ncbi:hypothetical protein MMC30_004103 [Trapelia coarctata]|nr:hypothetical protein [Trapelia coarctata]